MGLRPIIFDVLDGSKGQIVLSTKVQKKIWVRGYDVTKTLRDVLWR